MGRPKTGETERRTVRVPKERWTQAGEKAKAEGTTLTAVINACLERYIRQGGGREKSHSDE